MYDAELCCDEIQHNYKVKAVHCIDMITGFRQEKEIKSIENRSTHIPENAIWIKAIPSLNEYRKLNQFKTK